MSIPVRSCLVQVPGQCNTLMQSLSGACSEKKTADRILHVFSVSFAASLRSCTEVGKRSILSANKEGKSWSNA